MYLKFSEKQICEAFIKAGFSDFAKFKKFLYKTKGWTLEKIEYDDKVLSMDGFSMQKAIYRNDKGDTLEVYGEQ